MEADVFTLFSSDFYQVLDFKCRCTDCKTSKPEYTDAFSISFVRKGNFLFNVFRHSYDSHTGCILLTKPGYEHTVAHIHHIPDECTIIEFKADFYKSIKKHYSHAFFADNDLHSLQISTTPETEFLHFQLMRLLFSRNYGKLQLDGIVLDIIEKTLGAIAEPRNEKKISARLKKNHLITIEQAKAFIIEEFDNDISLIDIADECCISPFHFSRIFKTFTSCSPYQFLLSVRLKNAEMLLKTSASPIADVAYVSGFNSVEHFTASFTARYSLSPGRFREQYV
ncbi:helix-turn-helix transcriptional regulator [Sinomicrobium sp. FJxs]|uniref:Helix-turn-helix transcriptional regulator n=1 Tax=Sinomicrobium weinanense TaxID=2842200 RepID=A0A926JNN8_9FLAO|nr:helix-turn-helix transcriptional regulator [Sinomicrobium weinanense]